ncbi:MAG: beta-ketoacyl-[acyl-carrier-protein] synthase family protein [Acidobacteria bacterium]|jgi:3-oxoacyl-(acyl-carrier-protein) synthase|nr:beta-ketoacyl-[acyl-carrier-protein] synthase family protein [Acidobacteriota bacterium]
MKEKKRTAITGLGILTPAGAGKEIFWENCLKGKSYTTPYQKLKDFQLKSQAVGKIDGFEPRDFLMTENELPRLGRPMQFAIAGTVQAISDAGLKFTTLDRERIGICIGNATADTPFSEGQYMAIQALWESGNTEPVNFYPYIDEHLYFKSMFSNISTEIAARFGIMGPVLTMVTGCTAGIDAIACGFEMIRAGEADIVIAGAAEAPLTFLNMVAFNVIEPAPKIQFPQRTSSLSERGSNSFVLAEGCGICLLEEWEHARNRNAHLYAEITGFNTTNNPLPMFELKGDGEQLAQTINKVLNDAGIKPDQVGYISTPGSLIPALNTIETNAYKKVFGNPTNKLPISSTKPIIGHSLGAASAIEIIQCCLALERGIIPSPVNPDLPVSQRDSNWVPGKPQKKQVDIILTNAVGISGINSVMVLMRPGFNPNKTENATNTRT